MSPQNEQKCNKLKQWYLDRGHSMVDFTRDVFECRNMNSFPDIERAVEHLYDEHKALGNVKD